MLHYTDQELEQMLGDMESDCAERKRSMKDDVPIKVRQAICAFANDLPDHRKPGVIFIGANDDGSPSGLPITDSLLRNLGDMKTDGNILPIPTMSVEKRKLTGAEMAVITVQPSDMPPVKYDGRVHIRVGSRRAVASEQDERVLVEKRRHNMLPYDLTPVHEAKLSDLSRAVFEDEYLPSAFAADVLAENGRSYEERLASCRMIVSPDNPTPTLVGVLALGKDPRWFIPGAYIQFLRIAGVELANPVVDEAMITGRLSRIVEMTNDKLFAHNRTAVDVTSAMRHKFTSDYSVPAIQQMLYNALMHRAYERTNAPVRIYWYDDRVEINSPGGPYGNVTADNFGKPGVTDYRNPNIADVFKVFGFVQGYGRGIEIARRECRKIGKPGPIFEVDRSSVTCILQNGRNSRQI
jgi:ATP-dependent DNA helicase RecG